MKSFAILACILILASIAVAGGNPAPVAGAGNDGSSNSITYTQNYLVDGWLNLTRTVVVSRSTPSCLTMGFTGACGNTGAIAAGIANTTETSVAITARNTGPIARSGVDITESMSAVPEGVMLSFDPLPAAYSGGSASWQIGSLAQGEEKSVSYSFNALLGSGAVGRIPAITANADPVGLVLSVPDSGNSGGRITMFLRADGGQAMPGTEIDVGTPDGASIALKTDAKGIASFYAGSDGTYTYSVPGYGLEGMPATEISELAAPAPIAAAAVTANSQILSSVLGMLPIFAAIFAIAVVMFLLYGFFYSRKQDEDDGNSGVSVTQPAQAPSAPVYTQSFSFGESSKQEDNVDERTRGIISSRKKQMSDAGETGREDAEESHDDEGDAADDGSNAAEEDGTDAKEDGDAQDAGAEEDGKKDGESQDQDSTDGGEGGRDREEIDEGAQARDEGEEASEKTVMGDSLDEEIAELEEDAREGGEGASGESEADIARLEEGARPEGGSAGEEKSIEETIAELEKIRAKLRRKSNAMKEKNEEDVRLALEDAEEGKPDEGTGNDKEGKDVDSLETGALLDDGEKEEREEKKPESPRKKAGAAPRVAKPRAIPKGNKAKMKSRGVRRKK